MTEYLQIKNFGPIVDIEFERITPLTVLIGESGSGKSTIMKVLSMFRWIYKRIVLRSYVRQAKIKKTGIGFQMRTLFKVSQLDEYLYSDTFILYRKGDYEILYSNGSLKAKADIPSEKLSLEKICYISDKRSIIPDFLENNIERRMANYYLQDTIDNFIMAADVIKFLPMDYLNVDLKIEKTKKGDMFMIKGHDGVFDSIQLRNASSGTQTVTPLSLIVEYYANKFDPKESMNYSLFSYLQDNDRLKDFNTAKNIGEIESQNVHLFIEEPELSLYPDSQLSLIDFLVDRCFICEHPYKMTLMMATHSPYIVNYLNVLIRRDGSGPNKVHMNPDDVSVYEIYEGYAGSLKVEDGRTVFDTRSMSEPISGIYNEYNTL